VEAWNKVGRGEKKKKKMKKSTLPTRHATLAKGPNKHNTADRKAILNRIGGGMRVFTEQTAVHG
jgi:hypothetical protein